MRLKYSKLCTLLIIAFNIFLVYYTWKLFIGKTIGRSLKFSNNNAIAPVTEKSKPKDKIQSANKHIKKTITILFRDFYHFENDLKMSIESIVALIPSVQILVIYDEEPYPPMDYLRNYTVRNNVKLMRLGFDINKSAKFMSPIFQIRTKYVLILPDSVRLGGRSIIQKMLKEMGSTESHIDDASEKAIKKENSVRGPKNMLVVPFASNVRDFSSCCSINLDFANWTIEYSVINGSTHCDMFLQKHAIFIETTTLKEMPDPLSAPFPEFFYIQSKVAQIQLSPVLSTNKGLVVPAMQCPPSTLKTIFALVN
ncbi:Ribitol 5-phosphate transferase FKRP [Pseudolycoriella hygida]|uniref:Ribitol 5-phosphate transferase FKRP n=1 Tax=Pseudolycoriella hygida TaxID=35572 RepID=A0A9Q0S4R4_9DIPT|nr:Ribitol 5-phosphate transferase FKRP [Pseudolycoriella hygida]